MWIVPCLLACFKFFLSKAMWSSQWWISLVLSFGSSRGGLPSLLQRLEMDISLWLIWRNQTSFFLLVGVLQPGWAAKVRDVLEGRFFLSVRKDILISWQRLTVRSSPLVCLRMNPLLYFPCSLLRNTNSRIWVWRTADWRCRLVRRKRDIVQMALDLYQTMNRNSCFRPWSRIHQ